jgi:hypothetical protein
MTPEQNINITELENVTEPSLTYKLDLEKKRIVGKIDNQEAIKQTVLKILNTERYAYTIYSSQYGSEFERLLGKDYDFIVSDLERTISEALSVDERILGISNFSVEKSGLNSLITSFDVNSIFGTDKISVEVQVL